MTNTTYNGWTNYATWRIALEWFDCYNPFEYEKDSYELSKMLKEYVEESLSMEACSDFTLSYALTFISDVNWYEIAENIIREEVQDEN
jgi:hypothetical protein